MVGLGIFFLFVIVYAAICLVFWVTFYDNLGMEKHGDT